MSGLKAGLAAPIHQPIAAPVHGAAGESVQRAPVPTLKPSDAREHPQAPPAGQLDPIQVQLIAFGGTKTIINAQEVEFALAGPCSASEFLDQVCQRYPQLEVQRGALRLAVNGAYVGNEHRIGRGDEVALIPPVAGG